MSNEPRVSIGLPVFNGEHYLDQTIDSIQAQTLEAWELIIADNHSTDATEEICRGRAASDSRIRYIRNPRNLGGPANYNLVFHAARAPLFKWASSNDILGPDLLQCCVEALDRHPEAVAAYPLTHTFSDDIARSQPYPETMKLTAPSAYDRFRAFLHGVQLNNVMNGVIRSEVLRKTALHGTYYSSDICMVAELALRGALIEVDGAVFYRRMAPDARVENTDVKRLLEHWAPNAKHLPGFQSWRFLGGLAGAVLRAHPGLSDTRRALGFVLRLAYWRKQALASELLRVFRPEWTL